jgi:hypothetical protein
MDKFEYTTLGCTPLYDSQQASFIRMGEEGWELVCCVRLEGSNYTVFYFKRKIINHDK